MSISNDLTIVLLFVVLASFINLSVSNEPKTFNRLLLGPNQRGPEAIAFDCKGQGPYVGIYDGRILKWEGEDIGWTEFAVTASNRSTLCNGIFNNSSVEKDCGRPLGLKFDMVTCELYVADANFGLMKVCPNGGVASSLAESAEEIPFIFLNGLDFDSKNKVVYFTDTSIHYHIWEVAKAINNSDRSGRFMKYDVKTGNITVLLKDLSFANGVALSKKKDFVLVAETTTLQVLKYWLTGSKAGSHEVFLQLNGRPDNINTDANGDFWIAERMAKSIKVDRFGKLLETLDDEDIVNPSDVQEFKNRIWIGFVDQPYILYTS